MKIRECFVSNSSSCSFVVIGNSLDKSKLSKKPWENGDLEFSYGTWTDADSKLNFLFLQNAYCNEQYEMSEKLKTFCKNHDIDYDEYADYISKCLESYCNDADDESEEIYPEAYIDHQSIIENGYYTFGLIDIFDSDDSLERFVMDKDSVLIMGRD